MIQGRDEGSRRDLLVISLEGGVHYLASCVKGLGILNLQDCFYCPDRRVERYK